MVDGLGMVHAIMSNVGMENYMTNIRPLLLYATELTARDDLPNVPLKLLILDAHV